MRTYGRSWNPQKEDPTLCVESVMEPGRGVGSYQCQRKRGFGPTGEYCKQHSPEGVAARRERQKAKWDRERENSPWRIVERLKEENAILKKRVAELEAHRGK